MSSSPVFQQFSDTPLAPTVMPIITTSNGHQLSFVVTNKSKATTLDLRTQEIGYYFRISHCLWRYVNKANNIQEIANTIQTFTMQQACTDCKDNLICIKCFIKNIHKIHQTELDKIQREIDAVNSIISQRMESIAIAIYCQNYVNSTYDYSHIFHGNNGLNDPVTIKCKTCCYIQIVTLETHFKTDMKCSNCEFFRLKRANATANPTTIKAMIDNQPKPQMHPMPFNTRFNMYGGSFVPHSFPAFLHSMRVPQYFSPPVVMGTLPPLSQTMVEKAQELEKPVLHRQKRERNDNEFNTKRIKRTESSDKN